MKKHLSILFLGLILFACGDSNRSNLASFESPKDLFVDQISAYTSGVISAGSSIKIRLAENLDSIVASTITPDLIQFDPPIKGSLSMEDQRTLVFSPDQALPNDQEYKAKLNLAALVDTKADQNEFKFTFTTLSQNYQVDLDGIELYSIKNLESIKLKGILQTADLADNQEIEKIITATQNNGSLEITWNHDFSNNKHAFTIEKVKRTKKASQVKVSWSGSAIGVEGSGEEEYAIPALDDYKVVAINMSRGRSNYLSVVFSDPIDQKQNLRGFFTLDGNEPRYTVEKNVVKLYPTNEVSGDVQLKIFHKIKNIAGYSLKEDYESTIRLTQSKPEVKIVANSGAIIPSSEGLIVPFEAVGLKAVEVTVVKVYQENIIQYLQVNDLGESSEMSRVGKPMLKKTINLMGSGVTDLNRWNRFTLDLADLIKVDPGAMYEIRLGFRQQHSNYFCANGDQDNELQMPETDQWEDTEENSNWDSYEYYYNDSYDWRERENPCHASYYMYKDKKKKLVFASNLGLIAKRADQGKLNLFVTNLVDTEPMKDVSFAVYDYQQQVIGSGVSDGQGQAKIKIDGVPFLVMAKKEKEFGYLKLNDGNSLSLSNFNVAGQEVQKGIKGLIYGERGVWRPGDAIHLTFILEDKEDRLPEGYPVVFELKNPNGQMVKKMVKTESVEGMYNFSIATNQDAPTGLWSASVNVGGVKFSKRLRIETVKPNRLKIDLDFKRERLTAADDDITGFLDVKWLHGAIAKGLKAEFEMTVAPIKTKFEKFPNFSFDDNTKYFYAEHEEIFSGRLDQNGKAQINVPLGTKEGAPGALKAIFTGKVYEEGGNFSIDKISIPYFPYISFVGIKAPDGDHRGMLLTDEDQPIQIVTVDTEGNPVNRDDMILEVFKLDWKWWWDNSATNVNYYSTSYSSPITSTSVSTQNGKGSWNLKIKYPDWGRYYVRVTDEISGHSAGKVVFVDWPGWAGKAKKGDVGGVSMLNFEVEKESYKVGDEVKINFPSTKGARVLVSLETGKSIIQSFWVATEDESTTVQFKATADMAPNIYANISLVQPHAQTANDLPIRMYGIQSIKVIDDNTTLKPKLVMPEELGPEQTFTVKVSEESGKKMAYTIAMVDEGLLDLTNYRTPSPWSSFYAKEALGIKTWDIYDDVIGAYGGKMERLLAIGGDGEFKAKEKGSHKSNRFKPVVEYLGPFYLEAGKTAEHEITMPQYVGSVRTMVVASSNGAYGSTDKTTPVKQPVMVLATLPRVAGPGEKMSLPVTVFVNDEKLKQVEVAVKSSGGLKVIGASTKQIKFASTGEQVVYFDVEAAQVLGQGKISVSAKSGSSKAKYDIEMTIRASNPSITQAEDKFLEGGNNWTVDYKPLGMLGTNEAVIEVSTLPAINLEQRLKYLMRYPHGCIEQTVSSVFAQLYLDKLVNLTDDQKSETSRNIDAAIARLRNFQTSNGGFTYWPGQLEESDWGSNYAGHFLIEAKKAGFAVPESMMSQWVKYQKRQANQWSKGGRRRSDLVQAYRLYGLALAGEKVMGAMNRLNQTDSLSSIAKWRLALTYAVAGYEDNANDIIAGLSIEVKNYRELSYTYGSTTRDEAMILETLARLGKNEEAFAVLERIARKMSDPKQWLSTQTTAFSLIGITAYTDGIDTDDISFEVSQSGANSKFDQGSYVTSVMVSNVDKVSSLVVSNKGEAPIYTRLIRTGIPLTGDEVAASESISMKVVYVDDQGNQLNPKALPQSTNFVARVTVQNPGLKGDYEELALTQIFPSGWEILNTRLDGTDQYAAGDKPEYLDIRDDRVMMYFDLKANERKTFEVKLNASYKGNYYLPAVALEAMYDDGINANTAGTWVNVE
ncbi:MAG: MG2 domain-containing protein [Reichenbachiella sp.]